MRSGRELRRHGRRQDHGIEHSDDRVDDDDGPDVDRGGARVVTSEDSLDDSPLKWDHTVGPDQPSGDDGSPMTLPECPEFDPGRVYLHGTLSEGAAYADATVVLEDGVYSTSPDADAMPQLRSGAIDAGGDFWRTAYDANTVDVIMRRRLAPDESKVVYREDQDPEPAVKIHGSRLFTGP